MNQLPSTPPSQSEQVDLGQNAQNLYSTMHHHHHDEEGDDSRSHNSEEDEDNMTEINVDDINHENGQVVSRLERNSNTMVQHWTPAEEEEFEQARREHLHQELLRIQRTNFYHFGLICLVPLVMLLLVVITSLNQDGSCEADFGTECFYENRGFMSAFARQCICKGIKVVAG
jgi:hypothetical protein